MTEGGTLEFVVSLASTSGTDVTFDYTTFDGSASIADSDYTQASAVALTIPAGELLVTIAVATRLIGDLAYTLLNPRIRYA